MRTLFWIICVSMAIADVHAAGNPLGGAGNFKNDSPIEINADTLEVFQQENRAVFSGHVVAVQDKVRLKADKMNVFYSAPQDKKKDAKQVPGTQDSIKKIEVEGGVFLSTPEETASGAGGTYDVTERKIYLTKNVVLTRGKNVLKGDRLVYNFVTGMSTVSSGGVESAGGGGKQRVRALFVPDKKPGEQKP